LRGEREYAEEERKQMEMLLRIEMALN